MSAALGLPGAMLQPLSREFGWSTEQISSSLALRFALFGLLGPFAAGMMGRFGLRAVGSGEGRVGEEGRSRGAPDHLKKKKKIKKEEDGSDKKEKWKAEDNVDKLKQK